MADRIESTSKSSSNTSAGDSEHTIKRSTSLVAESPKQGMNTPVKTVINVIPADENNETISPKRERYSGVEAEELTINKRNHTEGFEQSDTSNNLAPPPAERPSITITTADVIRPTALFSSPSPIGVSNTISLMGGGNSSSACQNHSLFSSAGQSSFLATQPKALFQSGPQPLQAGLASSLSQFNSSSPSLFGVSSSTLRPNNATPCLKYSQKCAILFENSNQSLQSPAGCFKSEIEKEKVLFESSCFEPKQANLTHLEKAHKDPHGLDWLEAQGLDEKVKTEKVEKKKEFRFEEAKLKKKVVKNPFELLLPNKKPFQVFKNTSSSSEYNSPCITINYILKEQEVSQKIIRRKKFSLLPGYKTYPELENLNEMSENELKSVNDFSIQNEFGIITFEPPVNLNQVGLLEDIIIEKGKVSAYPRKDIPETGTGLNNPAIVTLFHCLPSKPIPVCDFVDVLTELCKRFDSKFVSWDKKTGKWMFRIKDFQNFHNI